MSEEIQKISKETIIIPEIREEDRKKIIREIKKTEKKQHKKKKEQKKCIICGKKAEYKVKGMPNNTYCKECAKENFKFLNYLEKIK